MVKKRKIVIGRYCKGKGGLVMDEGSLPHCGNKECSSCNMIWEAVDKELKQQLKDGTLFKQAVPAFGSKEMRDRYKHIGAVTGTGTEHILKLFNVRGELNEEDMWQVKHPFHWVDVQEWKAETRFKELLEQGHTGAEAHAILAKELNKE